MELNLPHTLTIQNSNITGWYYTTKSKDLIKKSKIQKMEEAAEEWFRKKKKVGKSGVVAYFINSNSLDQFGRLRIQYFTPEELSEDDKLLRRVLLFI